MHIDPSRPIILGLILAASVASPAQAGWGISWTFGGGAGIATNGSAYNNAGSPSGTQAAFIQSQGFAEQSFTVPADGRYTIAWQASVRPWVDANHDYDVQVDGIPRLRVNSWTLSPWKYTPLSIAVDLPAGKHTLRFQGINSRGGDHTSFVDSVVIKGVDPVPLSNPGFDDIPYAAGTFAMRPPAVTTPLARLDSARVTTSGRAIFGRFVSVANGAYLPATGFPTSPMVRVNGRDVGPTTVSVFTPDHEGFILFLPDPVKVETGDTVTLTAPMAWATVANDFAEPIADRPIAVYAGRSFVGTDEVAPTLKIGENFGHLQCPTWGMYSLTRNLRPRLLRWDSGVVGTDGNGFPTRLGADVATGAVIDDPNINGIDATGTATPEGLYAIGWGRAGTSQVDCSLASASADVTELAGLANPGGTDGRGLVRVFQFARKPGAARVNFDVRIALADKSRAPALSYLVVYGPGDFATADGTPTVLEGVDDPAYPSSIFLARTSSGVGTMRYADGIIGFDNASDACEPEHLQSESRFSWNGWVRAWNLKFTQARPWTPEGAPYAYSPLFGDQFPATIANTLDAPAAGTRQVVEMPDAATAPVIEGLVLQAGDERMRVLAVSGTAVTIERGSESTTPAARDAGPVMVSGRTALSLDAFGSARVQVAELVTDAPHHLRTGNHPTYSGGSWAAWPLADGTKFNGGWGLANYSLGILVTGPDRFVVTTDGGAGPGNATLAAAVDLAAARCTSQVVIPGDAGLPYSVQARLAAGRGADLHLSFPFAASDSYVDAVARIVADNYPAGRRVYLEYINEPWNWGYTTSKTQGRLCWLLGRQFEGSQLWQVRRTGQIHKRFAAVFATRGRAAEVRSILNMQLGSAGNVRGNVKQALDEGLPPPDIAIAPYTDFGDQPSLVKALNVAGLDRAVDLWIWNLVYGRVPNKTGTVPWCDAQRKAVDAVNKEFGTSIELYGYEGGVSTSWPAVTTSLVAEAAADSATLAVRDASLFSPGQMLKAGPEWVKVTSIAGNALSVDRGQSGTVAGVLKAGVVVRNSHVESSHDLTYHPLFRVAEFDQFGLWQRYFQRMTMNGYSMHWNNGYHQWCMYHWFGQLPGRGDGRDGLADNRMVLATPGMEGSKDRGVNQDLRAVSVRGQALIEWNRRASGP